MRMLLFLFGYLFLLISSTIVNLLCPFLVLSTVALIAYTYRSRAETRRLTKIFVVDACVALGLDPPTLIIEKKKSRYGKQDVWQSQGTIEGINVGFQFYDTGRVVAWSFLEGTVPPGFKLMREPPFASLARKAGAQDIQLGDPEVDKRFLIAGESESTKSLLKKDDVRSSLVRLCRGYTSLYVEHRRVEIEFFLKGTSVSFKFALVPWEPVTGLNQLREGVDALVQFSKAVATADLGSLPSAEEQEQIGSDPVERFEEKLKEIRNGVSVLWAIVGLNALVFLGMLHQVTNGAEELTVGYDWGATFGPSMADGQWWRLLSANYVHFGFSHMFFNMLFLLFVGSMVEGLLGRKAFLFLYTVTGVFGALLSVLMNDGFVVSAGASGAVFGVFGASLVFVFPRGDIVPVTVLRKHAIFLCTFIGYQLLGVSESNGVDHAAHAGGFLSGFVFATILSHRLDEGGFASRPKRFQKGMFLAGLVLCVGIVAFPNRPDELEDLRNRASRLGTDDRDIVHLIATVRSRQRLNSPQESAQLLDAIGYEVIGKHGDWLRTGASLFASLPERWGVELQGLAMNVYNMQEGWSLVVKGLESGDARVEEGLLKLELARDQLYHP